MDKIDIITTHRVDTEGKKTIDPTAYHGSMGTVWALLQYVHLLRKECKGSEKSKQLE